MNRNPNENEIKYIRDSLYRFNEEIVGTLPDIPGGNQKYLLIKAL